MKNSFRCIDNQLQKLSGNPTGNAKKRITRFSGLINGMIRKGSSSLPDIGSGIIDNIDANSKTTAAKRFVSNKWIDTKVHFLPFLTAFLKGLLVFTQLDHGLVIVIDGSQIGKNHAVLMVSVVWRGRGIPIFWFVKEGGKGHFKIEDHVHVIEEGLKILREIIPFEIPITVLGDGEFDGIPLQEIVLANGCNYVLRTACNTVLYDENEAFKPQNVEIPQRHNILFIENVEFTLKRFKYVNFIAWHDTKKHEEPIYLVSNLNCPRDIIEYYDLRYSIECLFKDLKSTAFNIHKTRLTKTDEIHVLVMIAALAFILLTVFAVRYDSTKWRKKVQRCRKDRKVLSFFTFANRLLKYFVDYEVDFNFSFQFSKNFANKFSIRY